jgi:hypothetical protein
LRVAADVPADARRALTGSIQEGYHLMIVAPPGKPSAQPVVLRAQVTEVAEGPSLTVRLAPEAAGQVRPGDGAQLVRPLGSTTAALRSLPGVIPITEDRAAAGAAAAKARSRAKSIDNLVRIGLALHNYHNARSEFPPAVMYGPDGKPWHSWRVLILPYLGQDELYRSYDFDQPWDSPKNRKLIDRMPDVYREPAYGEAKGPFAHYAALIGEDTCFPTKRPAGPGGTAPAGTSPRDARGLGIEHITDGTSNTMMVAPVEPGRKIPWTKPEDIAVGPDFPGLGKPGGIATPYTLGGRPGAVGVAPILFASCDVRVIAATIDRTTLNAVLTAHGGEVYSIDLLQEDPSARPAIHAILRRQGFGQVRPIPEPPARKVLKIRVAGDKITATIEDAQESPEAPPRTKVPNEAFEKRMPPDRYRSPARKR